MISDSYLQQLLSGSADYICWTNQCGGEGGWSGTGNGLLVMRTERCLQMKGFGVHSVRRRMESPSF